MPPKTPLALGLDIAKCTFVAVLLLPNEKQRQRQFDNQPSGFAALTTWLQQHGGTACPACMEATGAYWEALATHLHDQGHRVSVVNPKRIAPDAKSRQARAKTDAVDAGLIARFCAKEAPAAWTPPPPPYRELRALLRHQETLKQGQQAERNRLEAADHPPFVQQSFQAVLAAFATQLEAVEQAIADHFAAHPDLQAHRKLLLSIPGVGETTARWLLGELGDHRRFQQAKQVAAYVGLEPRLEESGIWKGKSRMSKQGNAWLRKALYFPAMSALRWNPLVRPFGERLRARGKTEMAVIGAAMRKLLHLAFGVLRHGQAFDAAWKGA